MEITTLRQLIGRQIGLPDSFDGSIAAYGALSPEMQIRLTQGMISYIRQNPDKFTEAQVTTATVESSRAERLGLEDTGFDIEAFFSELENEAIKTIGDPLASIGKGVSQSVQLIGTILPALVLVAIVVAAWPYIARAKAAGPPK